MMYTVFIVAFVLTCILLAWQHYIGNATLQRRISTCNDKCCQYLRSIESHRQSDHHRKMRELPGRVIPDHTVLKK